MYVIDQLLLFLMSVSMTGQPLVGLGEAFYRVRLELSTRGGGKMALTKRASNAVIARFS
jgi:hypothetical protein